MRIALAQINSHLGNFESNFRKIIEFSYKAKERHCDIVVFPEASLFGYHPMDLLKRKSVVDEEIKFIQKLKKKLPQDIAVVFGAFTHNPSKQGKPYFNSAIVLNNGRILGEFHKQLLPTYDVFDDARHIEPGDVHKNVFQYKGKKILVTICEDIWAWPLSQQDKKSHYKSNPLKKVKPGSVDLILNLSASPYFTEKMKNRISVTRQTAKYVRAPMIYVNMVGGQDELIFDGGSFAINKQGKIFAQNIQFEEDINIIDIDKLKGGSHFEPLDQTESLRRALVLGIRDFINKLDIQQVHLGLSGGIDSALVACLAVDALGPHRVKAFAMPSRFNAKKSINLARKLAQNIHIELFEIPIQKTYQTILKTIEASLGPAKFGVMHENIQARIRGLMLMAYSNKQNSLLLNTTNKSEFAAGYGTLYGDLAGGLSPIGDLLKQDVYKLSKYYNREREIIPKQIITRAPSAELRPHQKDQDTLPPYNQLDESVVQLVENAKKAVTASDKFLLNKLMASEFKRWQSPPILKVRENSFGQGRRMPIAHLAKY